MASRRYRGRQVNQSLSWTPSRLSGITGWFRADYGVTITGSGVGTWAAKAGAGGNFTQATDANRPQLVSSSAIFNGQPCISFDGVNDLLGGQNATNYITTTAGTIAVVGSIAAYTGDNASASSNPHWVWNANSTGGIALRATGPTCYFWNWDGTSDQLAMTGPSVDVATSAIWRHDTGRIYGKLAGVVGTDIASGTTASMTGALVFGRGNGVASTWLQGSIAEVVLCNTAWTAIDYSNWTTYVHSRYNITG